MSRQDRDPETKRAPKVGILVLNWNNWQDTVECLASVRRLTYPKFGIILVDNGSTNESVLKIRDWCKASLVAFTQAPTIPGQPEEDERGKAKPTADDNRARELDKDAFLEGSSRIIFIQSEKNLGFAGGNNLGIRYALRDEHDYVWILNSDTIVDPDALTYLVLRAESDERIGMVGSRILEGRSLTNVCPPTRDPHRPAETDVKYISGASLLARAGCVRDIGLIDEKYFLYGEEVDWCLQARRKGWRLSIDPRSLVYHKWGASTRSRRITKKFLGRAAIRIAWSGFPVPGYYEARNGIYFVRKNYSLLLIPYSIFRTLRLLITILLYDDHKVERWRIILRGAWDGVRGRLGMTMDPSPPFPE